MCKGYTLNKVCNNTNVGQPAETYIHQFCADTGYRLENLPKVITDRNGW